MDDILFLKLIGTDVILLIFSYIMACFMEEKKRGSLEKDKLYKFFDFMIKFSFCLIPIILLIRIWS